MEMIVDISDMNAPREELALVLELGYNGAAYNGFAKQKDERLVTVQGELERALRTLFRHDGETVCAGSVPRGQAPQAGMEKEA